jgi:NitT/TauT family transport system permease protein
MTAQYEMDAAPPADLAEALTGSPSRRRRPGVRVLLPLAVTVVVLAVWQLAAVLYQHESPTSASSRLPEPWTIARSMFDNRDPLRQALWTTLKGALIGLAFGIAIAVLLSLASSASRIVEDTVYPYLIASQMVPTIVLAPIVLAVFQDGTIARIFMAAFVSFFVLTINMTKGLKSAEPEQVVMLRSVCAKPWHYYTKLRVPACLPYFFTGLKVAAPLSVIGEIVVELTGAQNGLGLLMLTSLKYGASQIYVFWGTVVLTAILGYAVFLVAVLLERVLTPWQPEFRARQS